MRQAQIGEIVDEIIDYIIGMSDDPKMIVKSPYREIINRISTEFECELSAFKKAEETGEAE
jgi:hypothetical protein